MRPRQVADRPDSTRRIALSGGESELLAALLAESGAPEALWFTRFWTAKEAVAKAEGTGLAGDPKRFQIVSASAEQLTVEVAGPVRRRYRVACTQVRSPSDLPERHYVVAWTTSEEAE
jgi:phosphopantetheinyl transferase